MFTLPHFFFFTSATYFELYMYILVNFSDKFQLN